MSQDITKRPPSIELGADDYAVGLYGRLRCKDGWRKDTFSLLRREYARFVQMSLAYEFDVLAMWEYAWLVDATHQYLCSNGSQRIREFFCRKVCAELEGIGTALRAVPLSDDEKASMHTAYQRMQAVIRQWELPRARD